MGKKWHLTYKPHEIPLHMHAIPLEDLKPHEELMECPCGPSIEFVRNGFLMLHHAYDNREAAEQAAKLLA
jgi:hypothetical protein